MTTPNVDYKKRLKLHMKSSKCQKVDDSSWSAFRRAEKKYKAKIHAPLLEDVLDLSSLTSSSSIVRCLKPRLGHPDAYTLDDIPGTSFQTEVLILSYLRKA